MTEDAIRNQYAEMGVATYYQQHGTDYRNPHEPIVRELLQQAVPMWTLDLTSVLDLACGSGEVTLCLRELGAEAVTGIDPYTGAAYQARTGQAAEAHTFEDIAAGAIADRRYRLIVCSFALHLVEESRLPVLCFQLSQLAPALLIITPHKRPALKWHWHLHAEHLHERVRARLYR